VEEEDQKDRPPAQMHASVTHGIIPLIREVLEEELEDNPRSSNNFHLCSTACPHVSQKGVPMGGEWSCGYRNIQMLCHTLMALPSYRKALFNGTGEVPDVHGLQAWIDKAWDAGFDVEVKYSCSALTSPHARAAINSVGLSWEQRLGSAQQVGELIEFSSEFLSRVCRLAEVHAGEVSNRRLCRPKVFVLLRLLRCLQEEEIQLSPTGKWRCVGSIFRHLLIFSPSVDRMDSNIFSKWRPSHRMG
jgi:hypothetical protein